MRDKILKMTEFWYEYVSKDHHKDRDCHFYITEDWSYGNKPIYILEHHGYIAEKIDLKYDTYDKALKGLYYFLVQIINEEKEWANEVLNGENEWDIDQIEKAKIVINFKI